MKTTSFLAIFFVLFVVLFELVARKAFGVGCIELLGWWVFKGNLYLPVIFLAGVGGLVALIFVSARSLEVYQAVTGKPHNYIFLGDRLTEGFYAYAENDPSRSPTFVKSYLDRNLYPASGFQSLYQRKVVLQSPGGEHTKLDFFHTGNLIVWSVLHLVVIMFAFLGFLLLFKSYGLGHPDAVAGVALGSDAHISGIFTFLNSRTNGALTIAIPALIGLYALSVVVIKLNTKDIRNEQHTVQALPAAVQAGAIIEGKVIASDKYHIDSTAKGRALFYQRFTVEFGRQAGFEIPVYINWSERNINHRDTDVAVGKLKKELNFKKGYYDEAFELLAAAQKKGSYFPFLVTDGLEIVPYLEHKKDMLPELLELLDD